MRKKILIIGFTLCFTTELFAQKPRIGIELGIGTRALKSPLLVEDIERPSLGLSIGGTFEKPILKHFSLKTGLFFHQKGEQFDDFRTFEPKGNFEMVRFDLSYIIIPITARYCTGRKTKFYGEIGFYNAIKILQKSSAKLNTPCFIYSDTRFGNYDFGLITAVGSDFEISRFHRMSVELRHQQGITRAVQQGPIGFRNSSLQLVVGVNKRIQL